MSDRETMTLLPGPANNPLRPTVYAERGSIPMFEGRS